MSIGEQVIKALGKGILLGLTSAAADVVKATALSAAEKVWPSLFEKDVQPVPIILPRDAFDSPEDPEDDPEDDPEEPTGERSYVLPRRLP